MQKMKNLMMMLALAMTMGIMSCDEQLDTTPVEETLGRAANSRLRVMSTDSLNTSNMETWTELSSSDLPQSVTDYLAANYAGIGIEEAWQTDRGQTVILLENDIVLIFDSSGELLFAFDIGDYIDDGDDDEWEEIDIATLPQAIKDYVTANYPAASIEEADKSLETGEYLVFLDNELELLFDKDGNFLEVLEDDDDHEDWREIELSAIPQAILDYIAANYATATIEEAGVNEEDGSFAILLDTDIVLLFDKDGNFLEELTEDDFDEVDPADLPQAIKDYIAENHAGATIEEAGIDPEDGSFYVELDSGLVLVFDADGNYVEEFEEWEDECVAVPLEDLLQEIKDYVTANYPDQSIEEAWYNDEDKEYYVELDNGVALLFDEAGTFIEVID